MLKLSKFEIKAQILCCNKIVNLYHKESPGKRFDSWYGGKPKFDENSDKNYNVCPICGSVYRFKNVLTAEHPDNFIIVAKNSQCPVKAKFSNDIETIIVFRKLYKKNVINCYGGGAIVRMKELLCSALKKLAADKRR